jgi:hypothetical protein
VSLGWTDPKDFFRREKIADWSVQKGNPAREEKETEMADPQAPAQPEGLYPKKIEDINIPWDLDPHLQEQILARAAGQTPYPPILSGLGEVDVIGRLKDAEQLIPKGFHLIRRIGEGGTIITGTVAIEQLQKVHNELFSLKAGTELYLNLFNSVPATHCNPEALDAAARIGGKAFPGVNGSRVIVGIVDFGCDFKHANFLKPSGDTRLLYLWDQSDAPDTSLAPKLFNYGREFDSARINAALRTQAPYQELGYTPPPGAHGTHVMDVAAGNGREPALVGGKPSPAPVQTSHAGVAPDASLIFVNLKSEDGFLGSSRHLLEAVDYIFAKAENLGMPAVVNLSLSTTGGPHDGTTLVELGFEDLLKEPGRAIVVSAGNAFAQQGHAVGTVKKASSWTLQWYTDPRAPKNEAEIWYSGAQKLSVTVFSPAGETLGPVALGETQDIYSGQTRRGRISHRLHDPNNGDNQIDLRVPALANTTGPWRIELKSETEDVDFQAWIEQGERGAARFENPTAAGTLGSICCSPSPLAVGAYDTSQNADQALLYAATAAGPTRKQGKKPDVSAPGANVMAARAQGGVTLMSGTSTAAAHVTGLVALLFDLAQRAGRGFLPVGITGQIIIEACKKNSFSSPSGQWDARYGYGRIDGPKTLQELLNTPLLAQPNAPGPANWIALPVASHKTSPAGKKGKNGSGPLPQDPSPSTGVKTPTPPPS